MSEDLSTSQQQNIQCQNCLEFINASLSNCRYCGAVVGLAAAPVEEAAQAKIASACRDGFLLKVMAWILAVCFIALSFSVFGQLALVGFLILLAALPLMLIRWWVKYGRLKTEEPDYQTAKREVLMASFIWLVTILVWLFASVIQSFLLMQR
ncbi:MAG: hypothetical protein ACKVZH_29000 [Blastocatellia bacterium]